MTVDNSSWQVLCLVLYYLISWMMCDGTLLLNFMDDVWWLLTTLAGKFYVWWLLTTVAGKFYVWYSIT